ncbi:60S ribosomal protein [Musa troglodytarum]|uniref:60S ribosomal protein n=1 Tax=Musa troglodytarum TaxID=320322 RepID=A0A9E7FVT8_9LILI|nr:60S ribosomal protein [Musa troglodytarum]
MSPTRLDLKRIGLARASPGYKRGVRHPTLGTLRVVVVAPAELRIDRRNAVAQDVPDQEEAGEEDAPEQADPPLDPHEDRQHHQVQREAQALAPHQVRVLRIPRWRPFPSASF